MAEETFDPSLLGGKTIRMNYSYALFFIVSLIVAGCGNGSTTDVALSATEQSVTESDNLLPPSEPVAAITPTELPPFPCRIAFDTDRDTNLEVYVMDPDGGNPVNLTNNPGDDFDPVWSPDGTQIAFVSNRANGSEGGYFIYVMRADGTEVVQLSHQNESGVPDWSPDGNHIAFNDKGDIYINNMFDGTEVNLTNSPEEDQQPKFSPDGQRIAWLRGPEGDRHIYVMNLGGGNVQQVTQRGKVYDAEWTVDGRLFTHWENPDGICFNCVVTADGKEVIDAGGKGTIQQFLPFWTVDGDRVEMSAGEVHGTGHDDIFLVGEIFPDIFFPLTKDSGNNRNPDFASMCGPTRGVYPQYGSTPESSVAGDAAQSEQRFTIGYTGSINSIMQRDFDLACSELEVDCVHGENITELADRGVNAIINASNRWDVMGSYPQLHDTVERGIPVFVLNAETGDQGAYNLSAEHEIYTTTLNWMFQEMGGQGEFVYYNFGNSDYIQNQVDAVLKDFPGITAIKMSADYNDNSFTQQDITDMIKENPTIGAIWSNEKLNEIFWGINDKSNSHVPLTECLARKDELIAWKNELDAGSAFQCMAHIRPGGTAYEGIYVAYFHLSGLQFRSDAFFPGSSNTLKYDIPVITNKELPDWIGQKLDLMRVDENGFYQFPPMTPEEIKDKWFLE